jgi:hypothetical protein
MQNKDANWQRRTTQARQNFICSAELLAELRGMRMQFFVKLLQEQVNLAAEQQHACVIAHQQVMQRQADSALPHCSDAAVVQPVITITGWTEMTYIGLNGCGTIVVPTFACSACGQCDLQVWPEQVGCMPATPVRPEVWYDEDIFLVSGTTAHTLHALLLLLGCFNHLGRACCIPSSRQLFMRACCAGWSDSGAVMYDACVFVGVPMACCNRLSLMDVPCAVAATPGRPPCWLCQFSSQ